MNSFEILIKDLPFIYGDILPQIQSIREGPDGRVFVHSHKKAIIELDPKTFKVKGRHLS